MAERWQGKATKEAKGYAEKIDTAWDDIYMGNKSSSSSRKDLRKLLKIGAGLGIAKLYGDRQVEKYGNDALSRANDVSLELQQQKQLLLNDIEQASAIGVREKRMREKGIFDVQDPRQIMEDIVNDPATGLNAEGVARWNNQYGSGKALEGGATQFNFEDISTLRNIFNSEQIERASNLLGQHLKGSAAFKGLRGPGGIMPSITTTKEGQKIIDDQGYLNNVQTALDNISVITQNIKTDVDGMKWTDGILLRMGIKRLDREFIIKEEISKEINRKSQSEIRKNLNFNLKQTTADENLAKQLELRIQQGITQDIQNMDIDEALKILNIVTPKVGTLIKTTTSQGSFDGTTVSKTTEDVYMKSENFISSLAETAVTNTINNTDGSIKTGMSDIVESAESDEILMARYTDMIGERSSAVDMIKQTIADLRLPIIEDDPLTPKIDESFIPSENFDQAFNQYWQIIDSQGKKWNEGEFNRIKDKLGYDAKTQLEELEYDLINTGLQLIPYSSESRQMEIKNQLRQLTGRRDSLMDMLNETEQNKTNFDVFSEDKRQISWNALMNTLGELKSVRDLDDLLSIGHSTDVATALLQEAKGANYEKMYNVLNREGEFTGSDLQTRYGVMVGFLTQAYMRTGKDEDVAQRLASIDVISELTYQDKSGNNPQRVSISSLFANKIFGQGNKKDPQTSIIPLANRIFKAEEQYLNADIESALSMMKESLDAGEIGLLLDIRDDYIKVYQGKDLPPDTPSFDDLNNREQLHFLLKVSGELMSVDPSLKMRLEPDVIRLLDTATNIGSSQDRETAVTILNNMITQEFNLADLL
jgi:hypothetical protein